MMESILQRVATASGVLLLAAMVLGVSAPSLAQSGYSTRVIDGYRAGDAPKIDGVLDDALWKVAPKAQTFIDSVTEKPAAEQTEAWIAYDDKAIYVAFHCSDSKPDQIVAREVRYGSTMDGDDVVAFTLDPFFLKSAEVSLFRINPRGTQREDIAGGRVSKREWSGIWRAAARRVDNGWTAEARVPWEMLNYPQGKKGLSMGLNFYRYHVRLKTLSSWSNQTKSDHPYLRGVWSGVDPPARARSNPLQLLTYATAEAAERESGLSPRVGLDVRYSPTSDQTAILSTFPDFRNVERAVEGIQFSRTERYLVDTRPFFVEGRSFFPRQLYTPRISHFDIGGKVYGRINPELSYGFLALAHDDREQDAVANLSYSLGERFGCGAYGIMGRGGRPDNESWGFSERGRVGHWYQSGSWNRARTGSRGGSDAHLTAGYWDGRTNVELSHQDTAPNYAPALGFVGFTNNRFYSAKASYTLNSRHGAVQQHGFSGYANYSAQYNGLIFQRSSGVSAWVVTRSNYEADVTKQYGMFFGGKDDTINIHVAVGTDSRFKRTDVQYQFGKLGGHPSQFLMLSTARRVLGKLDLGVSTAFRRDLERHQQFIGTLGWEFDSHRAVVGRLVQTDSNLNWYLAFRNSGGLGHEVYLVVGDPNAARFDTRVAVKWVWAR